jgi:molybdopterin converting factor small subunit
VCKIHLEFLSWLIDTLDIKDNSASVILEQEIEGGTTVKDLLLMLAAKYPRFKQSVFDAGDQKLSSGVSIFYNGRHLELANGLETRLNNLDALIFVPVIVGG